MNQVAYTLGNGPVVLSSQDDGEGAGKYTESHQKHLQITSSRWPSKILSAR